MIIEVAQNTAACSSKSSSKRKRDCRVKKKAMEESGPQIKENKDGNLESDCIVVNSLLENNLLDSYFVGQTLSECPQMAEELTNEFSEVNGDNKMENRLKRIKKADNKVGIQSIVHMDGDIQSTKNPCEEVANGKRKRGKKRSKKKKNIKGEILDMDQSHEMLNLQLSDGDHVRGTDGMLNENEPTDQESEASLERDSSLTDLVKDNDNSSSRCTEEATLLAERSEDSHPNQMDPRNPNFENCLNAANGEIVIDEGKCLAEDGNVLHPCDDELMAHVSYPDLKEAEYFGQSPQIAHISSSSKKLLVLDVNGLLAHIMFPGPKNCRGDTHILGRAVFKRPFCDDFLKFCFQNFDVGIWSSRSKRLIDRVVEYLLGDLQDKMMFCWDMDHSTQTGFRTLENHHKPMVCKELRKIWESDDPNLPWKKGYYNESNTLLLDDSPYKALLNPLHTAIFPNSYHYEDKNDNSLGPGGDLRVYLEGLLKSENVQKYVEQHPFGQCAINETNESWEFYSGVLQTISNGMQDNTPISLPISNETCDIKNS